MQQESQITASMGEDIHIVRLGYSPRANLLPLLYPIEAGWAAAPSPWKVEPVHMPPRELKEALITGRVDAALLPPLVLTDRRADLAPLGAWGLSVEKRVDTAALVTPGRVDLMDGGAAAITPGAVDSTAHHLLRLLLKPYYGIEMALHLPGDRGYSEDGARLLFGDEASMAAANLHDGWSAGDMGVAWFVLSGLPLVWDVLVTRRDLEAKKPGAGEQIGALLRLSQRMAQEQASTVRDLAEQRLGISQEAVKDLFSRQRFTLNDADRKGLSQFLDLAARAGIKSE